MTGKENLFFAIAFVKLSVDLTPAANGTAHWNVLGARGEVISHI